MSAELNNLMLLLQQLQDFVKLLNEAKSSEFKPNIQWKDALLKILDVKKKIDSMQSAVQSIAAKQKLSTRQRELLLEEFASSGPQEKKVIDEIKNLEKQAQASFEELKEELSQFAAMGRQQQAELKGDKYKKIQQKQKFANLGSKKNWKPI